MDTIEKIFKGINDFRFTTLIKYVKPFIPTYDLVKNEYFDNPKFKKQYLNITEEKNSL